VTNPFPVGDMVGSFDTWLNRVLACARALCCASFCVVLCVL